jgi:hypothetical protein
VENIGVLFLYYIEEAIALSFLGPALLGVRPGAKKVLTIGVIQGILMYVVRNMSNMFKLPPFTHTVILLLTLIVLIKIVDQISWGISFASGFISFIVLIISEIIVIPIILTKFNLTFEQTQASFWLHVLTANAGGAILFIGAILVGLTGFSLLKPQKG